MVRMVCRVRVRIGRGGRTCETVALVNSGFESDEPDVAIPMRVAERLGLPYQFEVLERGTTDAMAIQTSRAGVAAGVLSIPCRYVHSPSEMVDYNDVQNAVKLLVGLLSGPADIS